MLPARYLDEPRLRGRQRRRAEAKAVSPRPAPRPLSRAACLALLAVVVSLAFSIAYRHAAITRLGYEAVRLEAVIAAQQRENGERETEVAALGSPVRIQQLAEERLGMVTAGDELLVVTAQGPVPDEGEQVAGGPQPAPAAGEYGLFGRFLLLVKRLMGVSAEAAAVPGP